MKRSAADFRAEFGRHRLRLYDVAPFCRLHPNHLGAVLNERRPLTDQMARRIEAGIAAVLGQREPAA
jgi:plasmid maintenance system antidote protein VapI